MTCDVFPRWSDLQSVKELICLLVNHQEAHFIPSGFDELHHLRVPQPPDVNAVYLKQGETDQRKENLNHRQDEQHQEIKSTALHELSSCTPSPVPQMQTHSECQREKESTPLCTSRFQLSGHNKPHQVFVRPAAAHETVWKTGQAFLFIFVGLSLTRMLALPPSSMQNL